MQYLFAAVLLLHGCIHLIGFAKAYGYANITQITKEVSKLTGLGWLLTALLFVMAAVLFISKNEFWTIVAILAVVLSQVLIAKVWKEARFGTIANLIILLVAILAVVQGRIY